MAELLIKATDYVHDDPEKDRRGCYKKGYPVVAFEDGHVWGAGEGLPTFVILKIPGAPAASVANWLNQWRDDFDFEVLATRPAKGEYDVKVFEKNVSATGKNAMTRARVESFLAGWGCSQITVAQNAVNFTFSLWDAVRSSGFWGIPLIGTRAIFSLNSYSPEAGIASITITVLDAGIRPQDIIQNIESRGGTITGANHPAYTFNVERSAIFDRFKAEVKRWVQKVYCRRRFYFTGAQVDIAVANGGTYTVTQVQALAAIRDKLEE